MLEKYVANFDNLKKMPAKTVGTSIVVEIIIMFIDK